MIKLSATSVVAKLVRRAMKASVDIGQPFATFDEGDIDRRVAVVTSNENFAVHDEGRHRSSRNFRHTR